MAETGSGSPSPSLFSSARHVLVLGPVEFVGDDDDRDVRAAQRLRQLGVAGAHPGAGVDDQHHHVGLGDPQPRLLLDVAGQLGVVLEVDAAGVEQLEGDPVPLAAHAACGRGSPRARRG